MAAIFDSAKDVLKNLNAMKEDPEIAKDTIDFDPQALSELEELSRASRTELSCMIVLIVLVILYI